MRASIKLHGSAESCGAASRAVSGLRLAGAGGCGRKASRKEAFQSAEHLMITNGAPVYYTMQALHHESELNSTKRNHTNQCAAAVGNWGPWEKGSEVGSQIR